MPKIKKEQLKMLNDQESKKAAIKQDIGTLETQKHALLHAFAQIQQEQEKLKIELEEKHGKINIDLKDGSFTKVEEE